MILLIDIGNTRIKWATLDARGIGVQHAAVHAGWTAQDIRDQIVRTFERPERVLVANVGGPQMGESLRTAVLGAWGVAPEFMVSSAAAAGVRNAYPEPGNLGVDRWLAMIAAHTMQPGLNCVASVGTAMTIDAVDASGRHLGGLIVPGPQLMVSSLLRATSDIAARAQTGEQSESGFADNTRGAVNQGALQALAALIDRSMTLLMREHDATPTLLLTGGARAGIEKLLLSSFQSIPDLVLRGLAVMADE